MSTNSQIAKISEEAPVIDIFLREVPTTKRLLYSALREFVDDKQSMFPSIGIISGLRQTGKTTLLKQLAADYVGYKRILYINFRDNVIYSHPEDESLQEMTAIDAVHEILSGKYTEFDLFLFDEITSLNNYEVLSGNLYDSSSGSGPRWRYKVLMTGSSPFHLRSLSSGSLGASRSKLFRLTVLKFIEYLHIVKNVSYDDYSMVTREDFIDYLVLKDLPPSSLRTFDMQYFANYRRDIAIGDEMTCHQRGVADLDSEDLKDLAHVLAYQLAYRVGLRKLTKINAGKYELGRFGGHSKFDLSHSLLAISNANIARLKSRGVYESIANLFHFLIESDIVNIGVELSSEQDKVAQPIGLSRCVRDLRTESEFTAFFNQHSISMNSPLLYSRLGDDILSFAGTSLDEFFGALQNQANSLLGDLLEVYLRGGVAELDNSGLPYVSKKLSVGHDAEIDIVDTSFRIMCESTVKNKDTGKVHLANYYKDNEFIRICTTSNLVGVKDCYHMYPWYIFCCMVDTRDVLKLCRTTSDQSLGNIQDKVEGISISDDIAMQYISKHKR